MKEIPADLPIINGRVINVMSGEIHEAAIKMLKAHGGRIGHVSNSSEFLKAFIRFVST